MITPCHTMPYHRFLPIRMREPARGGVDLRRSVARPTRLLVGTMNDRAAGTLWSGCVRCRTGGGDDGGEAADRGGGAVAPADAKPAGAGAGGDGVSRIARKRGHPDCGMERIVGAAGATVAGTLHRGGGWRRWRTGRVAVGLRRPTPPIERHGKPPPRRRRNWAWRPTSEPSTG